MHANSAGCRVPLIMAAMSALFAAEGPLSAQEADWSGWDPVTFRASDGVTIHGDLFTSTTGASGALILLFHQGGADGRGEYGPIVGRLADDGYSLLLVDQRRGGDRFGGPNRTVADLEGAEYGYCEVYPDLEAALAFARERGFTGPVVAWGSSYSASLAIRLAAEHPDELAAVLAFSPASGGPMEGCRPEMYAADVDVPVLVLRPETEMEIESVGRQMLALGGMGMETYVAAARGHGSSILVAERTGDDPLLVWEVVMRFLEAATNPDAP